MNEDPHHERDEPPPDRDLAVMHGALHLMSWPQAPARHMPVDYLLRSVAEDQGRRAIGVVLSGTGSGRAAGRRIEQAGDQPHLVLLTIREMSDA
jgi:chemotaxis response regulator CheB